MLLFSLVLSLIALFISPPPRNNHRRAHSDVERHRGRDRWENGRDPTNTL